jgi:hypothetical protein
MHPPSTKQMHPPSTKQMHPPSRKQMHPISTKQMHPPSGGPGGLPPVFCLLFCATNSHYI